MKKTLLLVLTGKDLDDALFFNRLRGDIKKIIETRRLIIIHDADFQFENWLRRKQISLDTLTAEMLDAKQALLIEIGKIFTHKLSDDLIGAVQMNAYHLGLVQTEKKINSLTGEIVSLKKAALEKQLSVESVLIITPVTKTKEGDASDVSVPHIASALAAAIHADELIFIREDKQFQLAEVMPEKLYSNSVSPTSLQAYESAESLSGGTKKAFLTNLSGLERLLLKGSASVATEIILTT
jgi:acetylglutamate kinase